MLDNENKRLKKASLSTVCQNIPKVINAGKFMGKHNQYQVMHNGLLIHRGCYHGEWMTTLIENLHGHHEPQEEFVFYTILKKINPNSVMVELGSSWGYYSMWFKKNFEESSAYLIEPNLENLKKGKSNFRLNQLNGIFIHAFISNKDKAYSTFQDWDGKTDLIKEISIDGFMNEKSISKIHILHSDIQGNELKMLAGATKSLGEHKIDYLFISTHEFTHRKTKKILKRHGYKIIAEHSILSSFSQDGLLVAISPKLPYLKIKIEKKYLNAFSSLYYLIRYFSYTLRNFSSRLVLHK